MHNSPLNPAQKLGLEALIDFATKSSDRFFVLEGPAGVGKTFLLNNFSTELSAYFETLMFLTGKSSVDDQLPLMPTATTNPAAERLLISDTPAVTIHSFLQLTVWNDFSRGTTELRPKPRCPGPIDTPYLVIIDEASYLDDKMLAYMYERTHPKTKFILMGDEFQLTSPTINTAPAFTKGFPQFSLNQQVRQDSQSALGKLCLAFRESVRSGVIAPFDLIPGEIEHFQDPNQFLAFAAYEMTQPTWEPSHSRLIAWRNRTVIDYNNRIITQQTGEPIPYSGQYMLSNRPVVLRSKSRVTVKNNEQVLIKAVVATVDEGFPGYEITYIIKGETFSGFMPVDHASLNLLKRIGLAEQNEHKVKKAMEEWLDFRPAYASTVDKAQGATYDKVFINLTDIAQCRNYNRVLRMLYTATSRARKTVYFYGDLNG